MATYGYVYSFSADPNSPVLLRCEDCGTVVASGSQATHDVFHMRLDAMAEKVLALPVPGGD